MRGALAGLVVLVLLGAGPGARAQLPDNRGVELDPEDALNPVYEETLERRDELELEGALERGESHLPTLHGRSEAPGAQAPAPPEAEPPEAEAPPDTPEPEQRVVYEPFEGARRGGAEKRDVSAQLGVLLEALSTQPRMVSVVYRQAQTADEPEPAGAPARPDSTLGLPAVRPGDGFYGRAVYAVNSDYPGPVVIELLEAPLAGAVVTGEFALVGERVVLKLSRLDWGGVSVPVDAWGVGLDCACFGVAGEVDRHWFSRVLLPGAVRFAEGFLAALGRPDERLVVDGDVRYERRGSTDREALFAGLGAAAGRVGEVWLEGAPAGPTVRVPRDTELVVMFAQALGAGRADTIGASAAAETDDE